MKKFTLACGVFLLAAVFLVGITPASATTLSFGDNSDYWPTWGTPGDPDHIGSPNFFGGRAFIDDTTGYLTKVEIDSSATSYSAGDLFIGLGPDKYWDYVIRAGSQYAVSLSAEKGDNDAAYVVVDPVAVSWGRSSGNTSHPDGPFIDHPYAVVDSILGTPTDTGLAFTDFDMNEATPVVFGTNIDLSSFDEFIIGFSVNPCANDVLYEKLSTVPEPGTMLLVGSCLLGLAVIRRRKFLK